MTFACLNRHNQYIIKIIMNLLLTALFLFISTNNDYHNQNKKKRIKFAKNNILLYKNYALEIFRE